MFKIVLVTILLYSPSQENSLTWTKTVSLEPDLKTCELHAAQINVLPAQPPALLSESWCESEPIK